MSMTPRHKALLSLVVVSIIASLHFYRQLLPNAFLNDLFLDLFVPLLVILVVFRDSPRRYGLQVGRWREGLLWTAAGALVMLLMARVFWQLPDFRTYYTEHPTAIHPGGPFWVDLGLGAIEMFAWEFLFRGFLLFALAQHFGPDAIWIHMVPFALAHFGKPEWETYSSIPGGLLSGWVAYRVGSFYPSWLIHWALTLGISWLL